MNKVITISRSFGSGGREIGKRLADALGYGYYDRELVELIATDTGFSKQFIEECSELAITRQYPIHIARTFMMPVQMPSEQIQISQSNIIKELSDKGDCIFVGRRADYILENKNPLKVFIYCSDMDARVARCNAKNPAESQREMKKEILSVDKQRSKYYSYYTGRQWGDMNGYNLCIDTAKVSIKRAVELIMLAAKD